MRTVLKNFSRNEVCQIAMIASAFAIGLLIPSRISVTITPSLQHRVFLVADLTDPREIRKDVYVLFILRSPKIFGGKPTPAIKFVGCAGGEHLEQKERDYYCNGIYLGRAKDFSLAGEKLNRFQYDGRVPDDSIFVLGQHKDSYDSRYFGFIKKKDVKKIAYPLF